MNGHPGYHWIALAVSTVVLLPLPLALLAGWAPPWVSGSRAALRLRAYGFLCLYALVLVNAVPRIADASPRTVMACTASGLGFVAAALTLFLLAGRGETGVRRVAGRG